VGCISRGMHADRDRFGEGLVRLDHLGRASDGSTAERAGADQT
jgi:hypothetical protein